MFCAVRQLLVRSILPALLISTLVFFPMPSGAPLRRSGGVAYAATLPERPRVLVDTTYVPPTGKTINVPSGGDFQGALTTALPGDVIILQAGATYSGTFTLPAKSGTGWIIVRSSAADSSLPPAGTRITPAYAPAMPKIVGNPAISAPGGAHHYRFIGIEFRPPAGVSVMTLIDLNGNNIILDRTYIHGDASAGGRLGVALNGSSNAVIDSYLSDWKHTSFDAQAIQGWNGPGPFKIANNYLEGSGENVLFGGTDASSSANMPSDIEVRGNYFFKPMAWKVGDPSYAGTNWVVKNLFELKNARRVLIDGNVFENNWTGNANSQGGLAIVLTPRNQSGGNPWAAVQDVTFTRNIVRRSTAGIFFLGWDDLNSSQQLQRVLVQDNLFTDIGVFPDVLWNFFTGMLFFMKNAPADIVINHNTVFPGRYPVYGQDQAGRGPTTGFVFTNNITPGNGGVGGAGNTLQSLNTLFTGYLFTRTVLVGGAPADYPADNLFPSSLTQVGFVDLAGGNYRLAAGSPYQYQGTDGRDPGADFDALSAATADTISGAGPAVTDTVPPVVALTAPLAGATVSGPIAVSASATDNAGVAGVQFKLDGAGLGPEDTAAPYTIAWDTSASGNGAHTLTAVARDTSGNSSTSAPVQVTVSTADTTPPVISSVGVSSVTSSGATIAWTTNEPSTSQVDYGPTSGYGSSTPVDTRSLTAHAVALSGLLAGTTYYYRVRSADAAGNLATSGDFTFTTAAVLATEAPVIPTQSPFTGTPFAVPGQIEAEDFDLGGEGIAYHDNVPGNAGGAYRTDVDVDLFRLANGADVVRNFETGEWLEYTINVARAGTYRLELLASNQAWSPTPRWHAEIDGVDVTGAVSVPNTGSWSTYQWSGKGGIKLTAGIHVVRIVADQQYFDFAALRFAARSPYKGTPFAVPGQIEAEDFDLGGEGIAYQDNVPGNAGGAYRTDVDVDLFRLANGADVVRNFETGEWLEYTISVAQAGTYRLELLVSNQAWSPPPAVHAEIDGVRVTGSISIPDTGSWGTYQWTGVDGIILSAGEHILRIVADQQYFDFAALRLAAASP